MMAPTYRELLAILNRMDEEDLDKSATVWLEKTDELLPLKLPAIQYPDTEGVLDSEHPVLVVDF